MDFLSNIKKLVATTVTPPPVDLPDLCKVKDESPDPKKIENASKNTPEIVPKIL